MCGDFLEELVNCKLIFLFPVFILEVMVPIMEALNLDKFNYKHTLGRERERKIASLRSLNNTAHYTYLFTISIFTYLGNISS